MISPVIYPHIEKTNLEQPAHLKRFTRIRVAQIIMDYLAYGWSVEEMNRQHPYLSLGELHSAMAYYFDHQSEIDQEIRSEWLEAENEHQIASSSSLRIRLRARGLL